MGIVACLASIPSYDLERLKNDTSLIEGYIYPNGGDDEPLNYVDVDKAWHGIHYVLTGQTDVCDGVLSLAVHGGEEFGPAVTSYGCARFLTAQQVVEVTRALSNVSDELLRERFRPEEMQTKGIYLGEFWTADPTSTFSYLVNCYERLVRFYRDASNRGEAAIQWLS